MLGVLSDTQGEPVEKGLPFYFSAALIIALNRWFSIAGLVPIPFIVNGLSFIGIPSTASIMLCNHSGYLLPIALGHIARRRRIHTP